MDHIFSGRTIFIHYTHTYVHGHQFWEDFVKVAKELNHVRRCLQYTLNIRGAARMHGRTSGSSCRYLFEAVYENPVPAG